MEKIILTLSGSPHPDSRNSRLLIAMADFLPAGYRLEHSVRLDDLPVFQPQLDKYPWPEEVLKLRQQVDAADAVIISTPEYLHTLPAVLKNALEWLTSSGEMQDKRVLPITFTPYAPRGEGAMQALLGSLQAVGSQIIVEMSLYQQKQHWEEGQLTFGVETAEILEEAVKMIVAS